MTLLTLNRKQNLVFNRIAGSVQPALSFENVEQLLAETSNSKSALNKRHQAHDAEYLS